MLTRRKKQNLFYLFLGILIGVAVSSLFVSFQVIKRFTKENFTRWRQLKSKPDTVSVVQCTNTALSMKTAVDTSFAFVDSTNIDSLEMDTLFDENGQNEDLILSDVRIEAVHLSVPHKLDDSTYDKSENNVSLIVEQWENPMNFFGYKYLNDRLIVYGLNIDEIDLYFKDKHLFIKFGIQELSLRQSESFIRFPASFLHQDLPR